MAHIFESSSNFTIEDIHETREFNYERTKHMIAEKKLHYYNTLRVDVEG